MKILKLVFSLTIIAAVCAAVLATVNDVTREQIKKIAAITQENAAKAVMPATVEKVEKREIKSGEATEEMYVGLDASGKVLAYAVSGKSEKGYGGTVKLMVGLTPDKKVVSYRKLEANETPGLGAKLVTPEFSKQFEGKNSLGLKVKKDGGDIEAITAATITSRAVCAAIADAASKLPVE